MPSGHVRKRGERSWAIIVELGRDPVTGKRQRRQWETIRGTKRQAEERLREILAAIKAGTAVEPSHQTTGEFLVSWLEDVVRPNLRLSTIRSYEQVIYLHVLPLIGSIPLTKLAPQHLQRLYREKTEQGLTHTVRLIHAILHKALGQAVKWGLVPRNVADAVERPKIPRKEMRALAPEEAVRLLEAAESDRLHALYVLAVACGLRQGELFGLKWEDVDLERGTLTVRRQLQWLRVNGKTQPVFTEPKSAKSRRTVALPSVAMTALRRHRVRQAEERLRLGEAWQDYGLVFTTEIGTPLLKGNFIRRSFKPLLRRAGLPDIPFHSLRHTAASLLLGAGESLKTVQEMLGHSSITLTADIYGHISLAQQREAARKMDAILAPAKGN